MKPTHEHAKAIWNVIKPHVYARTIAPNPEPLILTAIEVELHRLGIDFDKPRVEITTTVTTKSLREHLLSLARQARRTHARR